MNICQRCKLPLTIHDSLTDLSTAQTTLLTNTKPTPTPISQEHSFILPERYELFNQINKTTPVNSKISDSSNSFVMLSDLQVENSISNRINKIDKVWKILNSKSEIDFPVCSDCSNLIIDNLKQKYDETNYEKDVYLKFLNKLKTQPGPNFNKTRESIQELNELQGIERMSIEELKSLEQEKHELEKELKNVEDEIVAISPKVDEFYQTKNQLELDIANFVDERDKVKANYEFNLNQLDKLRKTNIYNDIFNISHNGQFGTINGLRLGNLNSCYVSWHEINAALGQVVLLLSTLTTRLNLKLDGYKLKPMGSTSQIEKYEKSNTGGTKTTILEAYYKNDYLIEKIFRNNKLDYSMVAILDIIKQIISNLKKSDSTIELPYSISVDKISGVSIKCSSGFEEWTNGCKLLLTDLKWVVAYTSLSSRTKK